MLYSIIHPLTHTFTHWWWKAKQLPWGRLREARQPNIQHHQTSDHHQQASLGNCPSLLSFRDNRDCCPSLLKDNSPSLLSFNRTKSMKWERLDSADIRFSCTFQRKYPVLAPNMCSSFSQTDHKCKKLKRFFHSSLLQLLHTRQVNVNTVRNCFKYRFDF